MRLLNFGQVTLDSSVHIGVEDFFGQHEIEEDMAWILRHIKIDGVDWGYF